MVWAPQVHTQHQPLTVSFLDVGQGDAIFITTPSGKQILIDGGRDASVLRELGSVMRWGDRVIDMVIATHPDSDHITGLPEVLKRYRVTTVLQSGVVHHSAIADKLVEEAPHYATHTLTARRGQVFDFGDGVRLHILFPDREVPTVETNTGSIVAVLTYADTAFVLSGDSPQAIEKYLVSVDNGLLRAQVLKAGHHGSKTSSATAWIGTIDPRYVVYSRGCDNSYGHPHADVVARFKQFEAQAFDTCKSGRITFVSDGSEVQTQN